MRKQGRTFEIFNLIMDPAYRSLDSKTIHRYHENEQKMNFSYYIGKHIPTLFSGAITGSIVTLYAQPKFLQRFGISGGLCAPFGAIYGALLFFAVNSQLRGGTEFYLDNDDRRAANKQLFGK